MPEVIDAVGSSHLDESLPESLRNRITFTEMGSRASLSGPHTDYNKQLNKPDSPLTKMESILFQYFSDVSVSTLKSAAKDCVAIIQLAGQSEERKKAELESLTGQEVSNQVYEELRTFALAIDPMEEEEKEEEIFNETIEYENKNVGEIEDEVENESQSTLRLQTQNPNIKMFVALNDPIRFRNNKSVSAQDIDAHWLEKKLSGTKISASTVVNCLEKDDDLHNILGLDNFPLYQLISANKDVILWYTKLAWAETADEKDQVMMQINERGLSIEEIAEREMMDAIPREVDLNIVGVPVSGQRLFSSPGQASVQLPAKSTRFVTKNYEQYNVPASEDHIVTPEWNLVEISDLPPYAQPAFSSLKTLNVVQSRVCDTIINTDVNVLLSAPTGAGKSNVALLAITKCLNSGFKCVCIAPLKALVQEQVATLQSKLKGFVVAEMSGDQVLNMSQLGTVDVVVATPEKWDVVTRKVSNVALLRSVGLVVIDEIHLLHDEVRGSVLENIVVRHLSTSYPPRLLGLSATLPNYQDIGVFLGVPPSGLFYFDSKYRPVPLEQKYIGVTPESPIKQLKAISEACIEKVQEIVIENNKQVLIFVHSRKETEHTRKELLEANLSPELAIGIHHAGLSADERHDSELKFKSGELQILVSTATLAWGVNLPAAAVIIKGTEYYDPKLNGWSQLSPQDVLQMLGRAGRPGFDVEGLGVIITSHKYLNYFASVATMSLPIQSYLMKRVCESLNAEISAGRTIHSIDDCVEWLKKTFWYVRVKADPSMYGSNYTVADIAHSALVWLSKFKSITYEYPNVVKPTYLGEIAANFYISPQSVDIYAHEIKPWFSDIDIIRVFSRSAEFSSLPVRKSEESEIRSLANLVPLPIRDPLETRFAKVSILLQAYISRLELTGLALSSDVIYVAQSASRLFRAIYELALAAKWGSLARRAHQLYLMVDRRQWIVGQSPLRQFANCPPEILNRMESSQIPWLRFFDLTKDDLGKVLNLSSDSLAVKTFNLLNQFPRFEIQAVIQPVTSEWLWLSVDIIPNSEIPDSPLPEQFYIIVETVRGIIVYSTRVFLAELVLGSTFNKVVPISLESVENSTKYASPFLFVRLISDKWLHCTSETSLDLRNLRAPSNVVSSSVTELSQEENSKELATSELPALVQKLLPLLQDTERCLYVGMFPGFTYYNCIQQVVNAALGNNERVLVLSTEPNVLRELLNPSESVSIHDVYDAEKESRVGHKLDELTSSSTCLVFDGLHKIGNEEGYYFEALVTRLRLSLGKTARYVGFGYPVSSSQSIGQWIGAKKSDTYSFGFDSMENVPNIDVQLQGNSLLVSLWEIIPTLDLDISNLLVVANSTEARLIKNELDFLNISGSEIVPFGSSCTDCPISICTVYQLFNTSKMDVNRMIIIMNSIELPVSDLLSVTFHANKQVSILTETPEYFAACVRSPMPLESNLHEVMDEILAPEIAKGNIVSPQDAMNWISSTFLYRRIRQNPSYYQITDLQDWVSELVESSFEKLVELNAVEITDPELLTVKPLPLSIVATTQGVPLQALEGTYLITVKNKQSWLTDFNRNKTNLCILDARIDISLSRNDLQAIFSALDQRQALVQSIPLQSSPLKQIPWMEDDGVMRCGDAGILSIQDFIGIEDDDLRIKVLGFNNDDPKMIDVAEFVNNFPIVDIVEVEFVTPTKLQLTFERDIEDDQIVSLHAAPGFPTSENKENWFLVAADSDERIVLFEKIEITEPQITLTREIEECALTVWLVCGSYIDADKEYTL